jgi:phosphoribosyl 1,2-cyclic phosphodiesterase
MSDLQATFWGVRGGYPVPGQSTLGFGGNTTCLEVNAGPHLIIIDAGTGIIGLGKALAARRERDGEPVVATLLFTHGHHDHTQGLPFFAPLWYADSSLDVFGLRVFGEDLVDMLKRSMLPPTHPIAKRGMPGVRGIENVEDDQVLIVSERGKCPQVVNSAQAKEWPDLDAAKVWVYHSSSHPKGGSLSYMVEYRGKRIVFATDTEGYIGSDTLLGRFVEGVDILIHDAEYTDREYIGPPTRQGWGHSTWKMAVRVGKRAGVKKLVLTHHNAKHDDAFLAELEQTIQEQFPNVMIAREGMTLSL